MAFQSATVRLTLVPSRSPNKAFKRTLRLELTLASRGPAPTQGPPEQAARAVSGAAMIEPSTRSIGKKRARSLIALIFLFPLRLASLADHFFVRRVWSFRTSQRVARPSKTL